MTEQIQTMLAEAAGRDAADFADYDQNIFDAGLIDSMATVQFLFALQDEFNIQVPVSGFERDEWSTVNLIAERVKELQ
ncbi:D-alanine--poly(phosphoribitol) ligase subunit DltC [Limosilactobacillus equigenerosi]|nr:D-alanine--poly(phosphoribitol) ligase subunit DltC [Limosilactobacillus equigenerosi]MCQ2569753.1 D-alanine--poly(phosphoribitol) ligase subunit DltC [Limosilactobacillus sp.]